MAKQKKTKAQTAKKVAKTSAKVAVAGYAWRLNVSGGAAKRKAQKQAVRNDVKRVGRGAEKVANTKTGKKVRATKAGAATERKGRAAVSKTKKVAGQGPGEMARNAKKSFREVQGKRKAAKIENNAGRVQRAMVNKPIPGTPKQKAPRSGSIRKIKGDLQVGYHAARSSEEIAANPKAYAGGNKARELGAKTAARRSKKTSKRTSSAGVRRFAGGTPAEMGREVKWTAQDAKKSVAKQSAAYSRGRMGITRHTSQGQLPEGRAYKAGVSVTKAAGHVGKNKGKYAAGAVGVAAVGAGAYALNKRRKAKKAAGSTGDTYKRHTKSGKVVTVRKGKRGNKIGAGIVHLNAYGSTRYTSKGAKNASRKKGVGTVWGGSAVGTYGGGAAGAAIGGIATHSMQGAAIGAFGGQAVGNLVGGTAGRRIARKRGYVVRTKKRMSVRAVNGVRGR